MKIKRLRDGVGRLLANRKEEPSLRRAEDRDLDALDGRHVLEIAEREMKALGGGGLCGIVCIHDLAGRLSIGRKANRTSDLIVGKYLCVGGG
jgi:hypothetical protein